MANARRDDNFIPTLLAQSSADGTTPIAVYADPTTHRLLVDVGSISVSVTGSDGAILDGASSSIKATVFNYTNSHPLGVVLRDTNGDYVSVGGGTQYTEDAAAAPDPVGTVPILVRKDTPATTVSTDGDNIAQRGSNYGAAYVTLLTSTGAIVNDSGGNLMVNIGNLATGTFGNSDGTAANLTSALIFNQPETYNGSTWDRQRSIKTAMDSDGTGIQATGLLGQLDDVATNAVTENQFAPVRISSRRALLVEGVASGTAIPVSGTFFQSTQPVSLAAGATAIAKAEDVASADADVGVPAMAILKATPGDTAGTDGDYQMLQMKNGRVWASATIDAALPTGTNSIGKISDITTSVVPGTAATNLGKAEDAAHTSGDTGLFVLAVSNENSTAFAAASGDYIPMAANRYGHQYVSAVPPSHASSNGTPITATTTSVIAAPSAGNHLRIVRFHIANGGATSTWTAIRDGASGTRHYNAYLPQGGQISLNLNLSGPLDLTSATRLDIFLSAAGSVEYEIDYLTVAD